MTFSGDGEGSRETTCSPARAHDAPPATRRRAHPDLHPVVIAAVPARQLEQASAGDAQACETPIAA